MLNENMKQIILLTLLNGLLVCIYSVNVPERSWYHDDHLTYNAWFAGWCHLTQFAKFMYKTETSRSR